jgi:predicted MFS family arabinose efflux permease
MVDLFCPSFPCHQYKRVQLLAYIAVLMGATLLFAFVPSIMGLMAGRFLHGVGASGLWTLAMAIVNDNVDPSRAGRLIGLTQIGFAVSCLWGEANG